MTVLRKIIFFAVFPFLFLSPVFSSSPEDWVSANKAYESGDVSQALTLYLKMAESGAGGAPLYYNLGNAFYRLGQRGRARLWYERALLESPGDDDVRANLDLIREQVQEKEEEDLLARVLRHEKILKWTFFLLNLLFFISLAMGFEGRSELFWWGRWVGGVLFSLGLAAAGFWALQPSRADAVVVSPRAEARTGPSESERVGFVVPEGGKVLVFDASDAWFQVGLPEKGLKGWVRRGDVEIVPLPFP